MKDGAWRSVTLRAFAKINLSACASGTCGPTVSTRSRRSCKPSICSIASRVRRVAGRSRSAAMLPDVPAGSHATSSGKPLRCLWTRSGSRGRTARRGRDARRKRSPCRPGSAVEAAMRRPRCSARGASGSCACPTSSARRWLGELGSDVPYFLVGGTALGLGRGDEIYPLDDLPRAVGRAGLPSVWRVHQGRVCVAGRYEKGVGGVFARSRRKPPPDPFPARPLGNDLEPPVIGRHPAHRPAQASA